jgi:DNA mismatch repair protein MutH
MQHVPPPETEAVLLARAQSIVGLTFSALAHRCGVVLPRHMTYAKGWIGGLLETVLGADAANLPEPDFQHLQVELKTLPVDKSGRPLESTYVCTAPLENMMGQTWETSWVKRKLARVLWIPVQGDRSLSIAERCIGQPLLWSPTPLQAAILQQDWEELVEMIVLGQSARINARQGQYLQIRPKAAHSRILCDTLDENGDPMKTVPKGFYLRRSFTETLLGYGIPKVQCSLD